MERSLFVGLFSAFDTFTGDLLTAIYEKKPALFGKIEREIPLSEILRFESFDEFKKSLLRNEIDRFRRLSYVEQFEALEKSFDITLKKFEGWPDFVEAGQRRNLLAHCDGVVSEQYMRICKREGVVIEKDADVGKTLDLGGVYFFKTCRLMAAVAVKLGQTLWRKIFPDELDKAEAELIAVVYEMLLDNRWKAAEEFAEFGLSQRRIASDAHRRIFVINRAIGKKFSGNSDEALSSLSAEDWSATSDEFRLAVAVLKDSYEEGATLMERIGKNGQYMKEMSYHTFPLFRDFRQSPFFLAAYERVFGRSFVQQLITNVIPQQQETPLGASPSGS